MGQFPIGVGITELRGVLEILKKNGGALSLAKLADESEEEIDKLLPLLDAGELLGLCKVKNGVARLTEEGKAKAEQYYKYAINILIHEKEMSTKSCRI